MKLPVSVSSTLLLLSGLSLCHLAYTEDPDVLAAADRSVQNVDAASDRGSPSRGAEASITAVAAPNDASYGSAPGARSVEDALQILRGLDALQQRTARYSSPGTSLGKAAHYGKKLLTFLFLNGPPNAGAGDGRDASPRLSEPLTRAVRLLDDAAVLGNRDALFLIAEMNFHGQYTHPRDYREAFRRYQGLSRLEGNSTAQHMLGLMYATGIGGIVEPDQAKSLLYHTFAAQGGDIRSEMTVAFRHHSGIGTPRSCENAVVHYKKVADKAIEFIRSGPPGGRAIIRHAYRLADDVGGVYGEGASVSSSGVNAPQGGPNSDAHAALDDVLEYLDLMSRKGDPRATFSLGRLHYDGSRTMNQNFRKAKSYFLMITRAYWTRDGRTKASVTPSLEKLAPKAAGFLGMMFLRGEGMEQSYEKAMTWFRRGLANGDPISQNGMGIMHQFGYGVPRDPLKAVDFFKASADQDYGPAQVTLGAFFLDQGDTQIAIRYFEMAARHGQIEAYHYLADLADQGIGRERSCALATAYYKTVAERAEPIHSAFASANKAFEDGAVETAMVSYVMAAEQGYEAAQANVAYLLDEQKSRLRLGPLLPSTTQRSPILQNPQLALVYWTRSSKQSNMDSMVKLGDYYLDGVGTDADSERAAACYQAAAEMQQSAQALWNLGWMHENGVGVGQDFHLAKRFYDQALETNQEAYLPVSLSLLKLRLRSFWNTITHGRVNSIRSEPEPQKQRWSFREWINNFLEKDELYDHDLDDDYDDDLSDPTRDHTMTTGDEYYDGLLDDSMLESFVIVGLAATLAFLVYYRQQRQLNHQQHNRNPVAGPQRAPPDGGIVPPQRPAEDDGFFPRPEDAAFGQWVAGGVAN